MANPKVYKVSDEDRFHADLSVEIYRQLDVARKKSRAEWRDTDIVAWTDTIADNILTILDNGH